MRVQPTETAESSRKSGIQPDGDALCSVSATALGSCWVIGPRQISNKTVRKRIDMNLDAVWRRSQWQKRQPRQGHGS